MNTAFLPMLFVALLVLAGVFVFLLGLERRVAGLEREMTAEESRVGGTDR